LIAACWKAQKIEQTFLCLTRYIVIKGNKGGPGGMRKVSLLVREPSSWLPDASITWECENRVVRRRPLNTPQGNGVGGQEMRWSETITMTRIQKTGVALSAESSSANKCQAMQRNGEDRRICGNVTDPIQPPPFCALIFSLYPMRPVFPPSLTGERLVSKRLEQHSDKPDQKAN
jgi:hypothetical protein